MRSHTIAAIEAAVNAALEEIRTPDIHEPGYQKVGTVEMGDKVLCCL